MLHYNRVTPRQESWSSTATAPLQSQSCCHKLRHAYLHRYTNVTVRDHLGLPAAYSISKQAWQSTPHCTKILLLTQPKLPACSVPVPPHSAWTAAEKSAGGERAGILF